MNEKQRETVDERIKRDKEKFLELLRESPVILAACKRLGISKATFFRWKDDDKEFAKQAEDAVTEGNDFVTDMAEVQMNSLIKDKHFPAIKYRLDNFHPNFKNQLKSKETTKKMTINSFKLKQFIKKPIAMHELIPSSEVMQWPLVIKNAYAKIWSGKYSRVIIKAPRGGGKSKLLGTLGFDMWFLKNLSVVNMGGSFAQAQIVYKYFKAYCDMDPQVEDDINGKPKMSETTSIAGNYFSCVTASTRQVRGPHPDVLISDETCESDDELIHAALPMVDTSQNPLIIMASTFHKIYGIFQETWDNAEERGYLPIQWDIFDIAKKFSEDFWQRPEIKEIPGIEKLIKYASGRTGDPDGWVPIENIIQAWKEKPTEDWFEVEYMGSRPSSAGLVLKPEDIDKAIFDSDIDKTLGYVTGATVVMGIDWGFSSMTAVTEFMRYSNEVVVMLDNINYHQVASDEIIKAIVQKLRAKGIRFIYADSAGKFENIALQNALAKENLACAVVEVVFSTEKEAMLGNLRAHFEQGKIKIQKKFKEAYWQFKRYRYQNGTDKPVKKDDHIPDSTMCALKHFVLGKFARSIPTQQSIEHKNTQEYDGEPVNRENNKPITAGLLKKKF